MNKKSILFAVFRDISTLKSRSIYSWKLLFYCNAIYAKWWLTVNLPVFIQFFRLHTFAESFSNFPKARNTKVSKKSNHCIHYIPFENPFFSHENDKLYVICVTVICPQTNTLILCDPISKLILVALSVTLQYSWLWKKKSFSH